MGNKKGKSDKLVSVYLGGRDSKVGKIWVNFVGESEIEVVVQFGDL